ncbi:hypothetical protein OFEAOIEE_LOCUS250 [Methylorubrum extorquens]
MPQYSMLRLDLMLAALSANVVLVLGDPDS